MDFLTEDQIGMCDILRVRWTIIPQTAPQPWIACSGCGSVRPFRSSGKIRLNANGKRLDAWLIYKCRDCDKTWNRTLFERRNVRDIDPAVLAALQNNDPDWVRRQEFDGDALRRKARRIDQFGDVDIRRRSLTQTQEGAATTLEIELVIPWPTGLRLDRLLATGLNLSRSALVDLHGRARLRIDPDSKDILRRPVRNGTRISLDISAAPGLRAAAASAETGNNRD